MLLWEPGIFGEKPRGGRWNLGLGILGKVPLCLLQLSLKNQLRHSPVLYVPGQQMQTKPALKGFMISLSLNFTF